MKIGRDLSDFQVFGLGRPRRGFNGFKHTRRGEAHPQRSAARPGPGLAWLHRLSEFCRNQASAEFVFLFVGMELRPWWDFDKAS